MRYMQLLAFKNNILLHFVVENERKTNIFYKIKNMLF